MNVIACLGFYCIYYDVTVQNFSHAFIKNPEKVSFYNAFIRVFSLDLQYFLNLV